MPIFLGFLNLPRKQKINCHQELFEKEGYLPFGEGYRRCPGEHLTVYLEELAEKMKNINYKVFLKGESKPDNYIWGEIDRNLYFRNIQS